MKQDWRHYLFGTLESDLSGESNGNEVLICVDEGVSDRDKGGIVKSQRDGRNRLDATHEAINELRLVNVKDFGRERVALVIDLHHGHTVRERRDVQHVQERGFGCSDTRASSNDLDIRHDFNCTTRDLGGNTESLEEGGFAGFHSGVACRDNDILGRERTSTGRRCDFVSNDDVPDFIEVIRSEDETNVALDVGEEPLVLGVLGENRAQSAPNHGVLAHQDDTLATEGLTNLMHLVGANIVDIDQEDGG
jgi:hypothetical protein